jgi:tetratricopeptide (TPR) repeat protein
LSAQPSSFGGVTPEKVAELEAMHQQATDFLLKNDFQSAIKTYSDILLMEPDDETAYTALGQTYLVLAQYKKAHDAFQNALDINPDNQVALYGIQKIMDPDGIEGMVNQGQMETEIFTPAPPRETPILDAPKLLPFAAFDGRSPAARAKKSGVAAPKKTKTPRKNLSAFGRPGLLHAQRVQMALKNAGYYNGPVNGLIGGSTKKALIGFQTKAGLKPNGKITSETWRLLSSQL